MREEALGFWSSLAWQGAVYAVWIGVALGVWGVADRQGTDRRGLLLLWCGLFVAVPVAAMATVAIDMAFHPERRALAEFGERLLGKVPIAILFYSAIVAAVLALMHWKRAQVAQAHADALAAALRALRDVPVEDGDVEPMVVAVGRKRVRVDPGDVEWIAAAGNYVVLYWSDQEGLARQTLRGMEAMLAQRGFVRAHRSALVNLAHVESAQPLSDGSWKLTLRSGADLVVSRTQRDAMLARLGLRDAVGAV